MHWSSRAGATFFFLSSHNLILVIFRLSLSLSVAGEYCIAANPHYHWIYSSSEPASILEHISNAVPLACDSGRWIEKKSHSVLQAQPSHLSPLQSSLRILCFTLRRSQTSSLFKAPPTLPISKPQAARQPKTCYRLLVTAITTADSKVQ